MFTLPLVLLSGIHCALVDNASSSIANPLRYEAFPVLATYYQPSCRATWFYLIYSIITHYIALYKSFLEPEDDHNEVYREMQARCLGDALWQVFVPGSVITRVDVEDSFEQDDVLVEDWKPLKGGQGLFKYSKRTNPNSSKKLYCLRQPRGVDVSYLMQEMKEDTKVLRFLHLTDCEPILNANIIRLITHKFSVTFKQDTAVGVHLTESINFEDIRRIKRMVNGLEFPGKFSTENTTTKDGRKGISLERQVRAGFIPTLGDYSYEASGLSYNSYMQMLRRMVAIAIQSVVCLTFGEP